MIRHASFAITAVAAFAAAAWFASSPASGSVPLADGPPDGMAADAPYFFNCTLCHDDFALDSGDGVLALSGAPARYQPGKTYSLTVTVSDPGQARWGFELAAHAGGSPGVFAITDPVHTQVSNSGFGDYVKHTNAGTYRGTADGPVSWSLEWTAPAAGTGDVRFYLAAVAADDNGSFANDFVYTMAAACQEEGAAGGDLTLTLQPDGTGPRRGAAWTVMSRARNHGAATQSALLSARVRLPNQAYFPATGSLHAPISLQLPAGAQSDHALALDIPANAPLARYTYEGYLLRSNPLLVLAADEFGFDITP